ncbi:hypothetical protein C0Q70_00486 [Pomacea canaliculata]|uniref:Uncharacterized protein n=1 Tax=Pomacea canaliculata TaxID=400727 RepID=A0A2T7PWT7_POMCA|nr:hypothetical protein C0Q70_00486 [Pomacea canaliculata]
MNIVHVTQKQTSTSGKTSGRSTTKRTAIRPVTTRATAATTTTATTTAATMSTPCGRNSGQHNSYVKDNLNIVRQKCSEFHACTVELYKSENLHRILAGDNIQLRNICGLLYQNANGGYRVLDNQCSTQARESIKEILGDEELSPILEGSSSREDSWRKLKTCLDNTQEDNTYLDKLCRTTESKRSGKTTSPTDDWCTSQGIRDRSQVPQSPTSRPAGHQPWLPEPYIPYQLPTTTSHSDDDYLLPDVACVYYKNQLPEHPATVAIQPPPQDRPYVLAKHVAPSPATDRKTRATEGPDRSLEEATYFDKIDIKSVTETSPDGGYTPLGLTPTLVVRHQSADSEEGKRTNFEKINIKSVTENSSEGGYTTHPGSHPHHGGQSGDVDHDTRDGGQDVDTTDHHQHLADSCVSILTLLTGG